MSKLNEDQTLKIMGTAGAFVGTVCCVVGGTRTGAIGLLGNFSDPEGVIETSEQARVYLLSLCRAAIDLLEECP